MLKTFIRPYRDQYRHKTCGKVTDLNQRFAEAFAMTPDWIATTYCIHCHVQEPVDQFEWLDGEQVGS